MFKALRSVVATFDRVSSRLLGHDGSVRNIRTQLDHQRLACEQIDMIGRRLASGTEHAVPRAA